MVMEGPPKPVAPPKYSALFFDTAVEGGATRRTRCQLLDGNRHPAAGGSSFSPVSSSPPRPQPSQPPPATNCLSSPLQERPRLIVRVPAGPHPKKAETDGLCPAAEERRRHPGGREKTAAADASAPPEAMRSAPAPMEAQTSEAPLRRSHRPRPASVGDGEKRAAKKPKVEFHISLSKAEIEADFIAVTGSKPPRHRKHRSRPQQATIDDLTPGLGLPKIVTPRRYRVSKASR